ncbi:ABC transporter permease [Paraburkholderia sp. USG1]|uniref:ABC transporter permease n=1 Tax=Paraburkholderia sp. USG1 TaxID=2952268 RepID=UPI00285937AD|nr:ABC transporter permease [Paraburkholderia sp. USG1]MDR8397109.1 ABC transporter permease [Paraburkholderia sp. USG1]
MKTSMPSFLRYQSRYLMAGAVLAALLLLFLCIHPRGGSVNVFTAWANQGVGLALVAVGQTIVVLAGGIDISIGSIMALCNSVTSELVQGSPVQVAAGIAAVLAIGALCGLVNGMIIVFGRIQPIVATLGTSAAYTGVALLVRPAPGGSVSEGLSDALTGAFADWFPTSLLYLLVLVLLFWLPVKRSLTGRAILAVGSAEASAFMSGLPVARAKVAAYTLAGIFAATGGLFLALQTLSGDATTGMPYTLNSVAAVVLGGTALSGGSGSVLASIAGAFILRTIGSLMFFLGVPPSAQPLFDGLVLVGAVVVGALGLVGIRNRLEVFQ